VQQAILQKHIDQLIPLLQKAAKQKNAALFLYKQNARTHLFMCEGIARLYNKTFPNKKTEKWYTRFKTLEDQLGSIDYWLALQNQFGKSLNKETNNLINAQLQASYTALNDYLADKGWYDSKHEKLKKFATSLPEINAENTNKIALALQKELSKCQAFAKEINYNCTIMENHVHELRRKLRWVSIYAQALSGLVQFYKPKSNPAWFKQYATATILKSPFNKLPSARGFKHTIQVSYPKFIALSFIINQLGVIKDKGLNLHALQNLATLTKAKQDIVKQLLGKNYTEEKQLLTEANKLLKQFFVTHKVAEGFVVL
jgi:hypothetical protein